MASLFNFNQLVFGLCIYSPPCYINGAKQSVSLLWGTGNMDKEFQDRIKSAMVIYQLEIELGKYVKNRHTNINADKTSQEILSRLEVDSSEVSSNINSLTIENSYLLEALNLCESASKNTSDNRHISDLRELFTKYEISSIRNAISHPNRPFPEYYWYRTAALATDPVIQKLHFTDVLQAFQNALYDRIETPPESWLTAAPIWAIPNNLPEPFEHTITGLVGRERDLVQLDKLVKNGRASLISVVAPGGVGKTSLVLEYLYNLCLTPRVHPGANIDAVIFITLKQDRLTFQGVELLDAPKSIEELKENIVLELSEIFGEEFDKFNKQTQELADKSILFFVDNLETILRDKPALFEQLIDDLPPKWRIIVTSRIAVDGAKNLPLEVLNKPGALQLARQYLLSRGQNTRDSELIERITEGCRYNPLAIRLCIDAFIAGHDISIAILKTNESVTDFSFTHLLTSLSETSQKILEAIFVLDNPTRTELTESLSIDIDNISEAIGELGRTSLIQRQEGQSGEQYSLSRAIKDLLRTRPNNIKIRSQINEWVRRSKAITTELMKAQVERGILPIDHNFIPQNTPAKLIEISKPLDAAIRRNDYKIIGEIELNLRTQIAIYPTSAYLFRILGRAQEALSDYGSADASYRKAIENDCNDPAALFSLASLLMKQEDYIEPELICKQLLEMNILNEKSSQRKSWVHSVLLRSLLFQGKLDEVFELTKNWKELDDLSEVKGASLAHAYKLLVEQELKSKSPDIDRVGKLWSEALSTLNLLIRDFGYTKIIINVSKKLIMDIGFNIDRLKNLNGTCIKDISSFVTAHHSQLNSYFDADFTNSVQNIKSACNITDKSIPIETTKLADLKELKEKGYTLVRVSYVPLTEGGFTQYVFAKDEAGNDYFLHVSFFENGNWARWVFIEKDTQLAIRYEQSTKGTARRKATEICWP